MFENSAAKSFYFRADSTAAEIFKFATDSNKNDSRPIYLVNKQGQKINSDRGYFNCLDVIGIFCSISMIFESFHSMIYDWERIGSSGVSSLGKVHKKKKKINLQMLVLP